MSRTKLSLEGKQALVLGLGVHGGGAGVARFLVERGARVTVTDLRPPEKLAEGLEGLRGLPIEYVLGEHRARDILAADLIVRNPGVPRESPWLRLAREHEIPVLMEMNLFWASCPAPITAITGSKGKSTTTAWLGHVLRLSRPDTVVAGNLRVSALDALSSIRPDTPVVLELSSWQLESFAETRIGPHIACVTNLAPDHLNRYRDMADYADAKREIYRYQRNEGIAVFNHDDPVVRTFASDCPAQVRWFGTDDHAGMGGVLTARDLVLRSTETVQPIIRLEDLALAGRHNALNAAAVTTLAAANNIPPEQIAEGLRTFPGLRDRMEFVAEIDGVRYINDTTSTVPASTMAALAGLDGRVVLIAGGASKRVSFGELAELLCRQASRLVLLEGSATPELQTEVYKRCPALETSLHRDLQSAVEVAHDAARAGDTVLFSPACASFGMFENEFQRGELFRQTVRRLQGSGKEARDGG